MKQLFLFFIENVDVLSTVAFAVSEALGFTKAGGLIRGLFAFLKSFQKK